MAVGLAEEGRALEAAGCVTQQTDSQQKNYIIMGRHISYCIAEATRAHLDAKFSISRRLHAFRITLAAVGLSGAGLEEDCEVTTPKHVRQIGGIGSIYSCGLRIYLRIGIGRTYQRLETPAHVECMQLIMEIP